MWMLPLLVLAALQDPQPEDSAVKIFSTVRTPDFDRPWTKNGPMESTGSGVILEGEFLITNAHVINYAQRIEIQPSGSADRFEAEVAFVSYEDDLALLRPEDPDFFSTFPAVSLSASLPASGSKVQVVGFPSGGEEISTTAGIVSRFLFRRAGGFRGLAIQTDAPINEGNSGGPVFQDGKVVGIAFQKDKQAKTDNVGYVIPAETVTRFIADVADGDFDGVRLLPVHWSKCENPAMRAFLRLPKDQKGVILYPSSSWTPENFTVQDLDVLLAIDGHDVDNFGRIDVEGAGMLDWEYQIPWSSGDGTISLTVWRDGGVAEIQAQTPLDVPLRVVKLEGSYPSYYVYGPVTFIEMSEELVNSMNGNLLHAQLMRNWTGIKEASQPAENEGDHVVVATFFLHSHRIAKGYDSPLLWPVLRSVDGAPIKSLRHLASLLENHDPGTTFFEFANGGVHDLNNPTRKGKQDFAFDHATVLKTREEILEGAGIRRHYSKDLADLVKDE